MGCNLKGSILDSYRHLNIELVCSRMFFPLKCLTTFFCSIKRGVLSVGIHSNYDLYSKKGCWLQGYICWPARKIPPPCFSCFCGFFFLHKGILTCVKFWFTGKEIKIIPRFFRIIFYSRCKFQYRHETLNIMKFLI